MKIIKLIFKFQFAIRKIIMSMYEKTPVFSFKSVKKWKVDKSKNPVTGRKITSKSKIFKSLEYAEKYFEKFGDLKKIEDVARPPTRKNSGKIGEKTYSITFGDRVENHHGMQMIGNLVEKGLDLSDIKIPDCKLYNLGDLLPEDVKSEDAYLSVLEDGVNKILGKGTADKLIEEIESVSYDKKCFMKGRVVNKLARWNNCIADFSQSPDYENGMGTVIDFKTLPKLRELREHLPKIYGEKARGLNAETNLYYNRDCYIGYHGDTERKIVICVRLGSDFPLHYQWYQNSSPIGKKFSVTLKHGDIYAMSSKAVGFDWRKKLIPTLRHAAGYNF